MLLPVFAPLVLKEYNDKNQKKLPNTLEEAGVTVVNINGINCNTRIYKKGNYLGMWR